MVAVVDPIASTLPAPPAFVFVLLANEELLDRWIRLYEELLADGPISDSQDAPRLRAFLDVASTPGQPIGFIGGKPVADVSLWRTNCAMAMHAGMVWCGRLLKPDVNGEPICGIRGVDGGYLELAVGDANWVPNDGNNVPKGPAIFLVNASAALPYQHVGAFGKAIGDRHYASYEGGGVDGTHIGKNDRYLDRADSYGRRIPGWWEIASRLPPSPIEASAPGSNTVIEDAPATLPTGMQPAGDIDGRTA